MWAGRVPSFKYAVGWICKRLAMSCPDLGEAVFHWRPSWCRHRRWKLWFQGWPIRARLLPRSRLGGPLFGRPRSSGRGGVQNCYLSGIEWLKIGLDLLRGYFIWELKNEKEFTSRPSPISLSWLKSFFLPGLMEAQSLNQSMSWMAEKTVQEVTWHSMRVNMLSEAVKAQVDDKIVGLQASCMERSQAARAQICQKSQGALSRNGEGHGVKAPRRMGFGLQETLIEEEDEEVQEPMVREFIVKAFLPASSFDSPFYNTMGALHR